MEQLRFENLEPIELTAYIVGLVLVCILFFSLSNAWKRKALKSFGDPELMSPLLPFLSKSRPIVKFVLLLFAFASLFIAIANPQIGSKLEEVKREGVDLVVALDLSNSMLAEDIQPSRLEKSKQAISKLVDRLQGDRIGLVVFGGEAYVQLPITTDYSAAKLFLSSVGTDIMPTQGTAIGDAIELSVRSFGKQEEGNEDAKNKAIVIITDGENHEDDAIEAAKDAVEKGITVHTIGMGLPQGGPIPVYSRGVRKGFRKDKQGNTIITKLNESMLQQISAAGNGTYIRANNVQTGLGLLFAELNKMEKVKFGSKLFSDYEDRFQYFVGLALFFLFLELLIAERKSKWMQSIQIFKTGKV